LRWSRFKHFAPYDGHVAKPYDPDTLLAAIAKIRPDRTP
jgi:hypothetical protein